MTTTAAPPFSLNVSFSGSGLNTIASNPHDAQITQEEYTHDIAVFNVWAGDVTSNSLLSGTPMSAAWGSSFAMRHFYGYVNHAERLTNMKKSTNLIQRNALQVVCVGASWFMKQKDNRSWSNYTASQVATEIGQLFHLDTSQIVSHSTVWPSLQMAGRSYFDFLAMLGKRIGYTFYVNGISLMFKPRQTNPNNLGSLAATYDIRNNPSSMPIFKPQVGATSPAGGQLANRQIAGIDPRTTQPVLSVTSGSPASSKLGNAVPPPIFSYIHHETADSQAVANAYSTGAGALNQMFITADAEAVGNALVSQGSTLYITGANGAQDGLWWTTKAVHRLGAVQYTMDLCLGRDSMGATTSLSVLPRTQNFVKPNLINGVWCAA